MSAIRVRKWLCRHPALAVSLGSLFWLSFAAGVTQLLDHLAGQDVIMVIFTLLALAILGIAASSFMVGVASGRSGLPVSAALKGLKFAPLVIVVFFAVFIAVDFVREGESSALDEPVESFAGAAIFCLALMISQLAGWAVAALVVWHRIRRGKWEVTVPVGPAVARVSWQQWIATHPVWTMNLLAFGTAILTVIVVVVLRLVMRDSRWPDGLWQNLLRLGLWGWGLLAATYAVTVGLILARRGQSTQRVLPSAFWFPITFGLPLLLLCASVLGGDRQADPGLKILRAWTAVMAWYYGVVYYLGGPVSRLAGVGRVCPFRDVQERAGKRDMSDLVIRRCELRDVETLTEGNVALAFETEQKRLDPETVRRGVRAVVDDPTKGFYLVAELGGRLVGQLMITYEWSDWRNANYWWVQSVYVWPEFRRRGIFRRLHTELVEMTRRAGNVCGLRLYVEKENRPAQQVYAALGLAPNHYEFYEIEFRR